MGTSLGGVIAQVVAARHPDCIDRLILSSTWKVNKSPAEINPGALAALAGYRTDARANAPRIAEYFFPAGFLRERPELIEMFRGSKRYARQAADNGARRAELTAAGPNRSAGPRGMTSFIRAFALGVPPPTRW